MAQKFYADRNAKVVARRVNDARSRLGKLDQRQVRKPPRPLRFAGLTTAGRPIGDTGIPIITANALSVNDRLAPLSFSLIAGEKLLITGTNGSGKSTLLHLIAGLVTADRGTLTIRPGSVIGHLHQEVGGGFKEGETLTAREAYRKTVGLELSEKVPLSTFGLLHPRDENQILRHLSLGQLRRLHLASLLADPPDILLLDEPTNHLSLPLVSSLEQAIPSYPGTVIIASHDRWLRDQWRGKHIEISPFQPPLESK